MDCVLADSQPAGYVPAAAVSVPTSPHAAPSYPDFFPPPVVLSSQMLKSAPPLVAQGQYCTLSIHYSSVFMLTLDTVGYSELLCMFVIKNRLKMLHAVL